MGILESIKNLFLGKKEEPYVVIQEKPKAVEMPKQEEKPKIDRFRTPPPRRMSREELRQYFPNLFD